VNTTNRTPASATQSSPLVIELTREVYTIIQILKQVISAQDLCHKILRWDPTLSNPYLPRE